MRYPIAERLLELLCSREEDIVNGINKLNHSLQCATLAFNDKRDTEYIVCALLHDIFGGICPQFHAGMIALALKPYICRTNYLMLKYHDLSVNNNLNNIWSYKFVLKYDYPAFKKQMIPLNLKFFSKMVREVINVETIKNTRSDPRPVRFSRDNK